MNGTSLYLDTARMGAMSPAAAEAARAFLSLAGDEGCSPWFEDFLREGTSVWPTAVRDRYPGLGDWPGIAAFRDRLRTYVGLAVACEVLLANRTSHLMRLAARLLFLSRKRVLTTDLEWPAYRAILEGERVRTDGEVQTVPLRSAILSERCSEADLVRLVLTAYDAEHCDAVFLSAVSFEGLRLPVRALAAALAEAPRPPFVVIDGAQALGHAPPDSPFDHCDFYLAGSHKWLRSAFPMGMGFCPRWGSQDVIRRAYGEMLASGELDDPLLRFTREIEGSLEERFGETVSLASLFPCAAAVREALAEEGGANARFERLVGRAHELEAATEGTPWRAVTPDERFRSGMLLLQSEDAAVKAFGGEHLRQYFQRRGIALTAYGGGLIRLSAPSQELRTGDTDRVRQALQSCA